MTAHPVYSLTPLENGLDFILKALECLKGEPTNRDLKYAVLHLNSGIELILKERLRVGHWSYVFDKLSNANEEKYKSGDFCSVNLRTSIARLCDLCRVEITSEEQKVLHMLKNKRNRLEHFGIVDTPIALKAATIPVLNFVVDFISQHLDIDAMSESEIHLLKMIREQLGVIEAFVFERTEAISDELEENKEYLLTCPRCLQTTMIIENGVFCFFCRHEDKNFSKATEDFIYRVLNINWHSVAKGEAWPLYQCPGCKVEALVDLETFQYTNQPRFVCFYCGEQWGWDSLDFCPSCAQPFRPNDMAICNDCYELSYGSDD